MSKTYAPPRLRVISLKGLDKIAYGIHDSPEDDPVPQWGRKKGFDWEQDEEAGKSSFPWEKKQ